MTQQLAKFAAQIYIRNFIRRGSKFVSSPERLIDTYSQGSEIYDAKEKVKRLRNDYKKYKPREK